VTPYGVELRQRESRNAGRERKKEGKEGKVKEEAKKEERASR
jgi:hypothetical protein